MMNEQHNLTYGERERGREREKAINKIITLLSSETKTKFFVSLLNDNNNVYMCSPF